METRQRLAQLEMTICATPPNPHALPVRYPATRSAMVGMVYISGSKAKVCAQASHLIGQGWRLLAYLPQPADQLVVHLIAQIDPQ